MTVALGLNFHHDTAACLIVDGRIVAAEEERWSGVKHNRTRRNDYLAAPTEALRFCLDVAGVAPEEVGAVWAASMAPVPPTGSWASTERERLAGWLPPPLGERLRLLSHHTAHILSGYPLAGVERAAGLVVDAGGSALGGDLAGRERISGFHLVPCGWERVHQQLPTYEPLAGDDKTRQGSVRHEHSLGHLYRNLAARAVLPGDEPEGSMMAMAALGAPDRFRAAVQELVTLEPSGRVHVRFPWGWYRPGGPLALGGLEWDRNEPQTERNRYDLAAAAQVVFEDAVVHVAAHLRAVTGADTLVFAGGCALNTRLNATLADRAGFTGLFVPPAPHDAGTALGAALYGWCVDLGQTPPGPVTDADWGPDPGTVAPGLLERVAASGAQVRTDLDHTELVDRVAALLAEDRVLGWVQGRMEFGPRALGHRSILAHPGSTATRDRVNAIKQRAPYRPLAPAVLSEHASTYFAGEVDPFMNRTAIVRPEYRAALAGVVHADHSARVQAVPSGHTGLAELLRRFAARTGTPVLINTSLNRKGTPIVRTGTDAVAAFDALGLDALAVGTTLIERAHPGGTRR
ncbi:MAG: carbamoyltransferase C-terminal domain-containing protein [Pseudonocardia sp.]